MTIRSYHARVLLLLLLGALASGFTFINPANVEGQGPGAISCPDGSYSTAGFCPVGPSITFVGQPDVQLTFTGSPTSITSGQSATLSWSASNAITCDSADFTVPRFVYEGQTYDIGATSGSVSVSPVATKTYSLTCTGLGAYENGTFQGSSQTKTVTITVTGTPSTPSDPSTPIAPTNDPTSNGFSSIFQIDNDADHSTVYATIPVTNVDLGPGGTAAINTVYAFPSAGTWYVRACGDLPPYNNGVVAESNENNNCSTEWTSKVIAINQCIDGIDNDGDGTTDSSDPGCADGDGDETTGQITVNLSATPTTIRSGQSSTLTWSSSGTPSCTGTGFNTGNAANGTASVSPTTPGPNTYQVNCGGTIKQATVTVTVPTAYLSAQPTLVDARVAGGGSTTLTWSAGEVSSCTIASSTTGPSFTSSYVAPVGTTTTAVTNITKQTRFTLTCVALTGPDVTSSVLVNVLANFDEF